MSQNKERLLWILLIGIAAFNKADYILTLDAIDRGFIEANPILAPMIGTYEFSLVKLVLVPLLLVFFWLMRFRMDERLIQLVWLPFFGYFMLMLYFHFFVL